VTKVVIMREAMHGMTTRTGKPRFFKT